MAIVINGSGTITGISVGGLPDDIVDAGMMADNSIDSDTYVDASIDNAHLADDAVGVAELSATGTASSSTFLRGDNAWAAAGGDNSPAFLAHMSGSQVIGNDTETKLQFDSEQYDTDSAFDPSTNYRFTVPAGEGGKYFISYSFMNGTVASGAKSWGYLYKNGSSFPEGATGARGVHTVGQEGSQHAAFTMELAAADYIEVYVIHQSGGDETFSHAASIATHFQAFKLIGI